MKNYKKLMQKLFIATLVMALPLQMTMASTAEPVKDKMDTEVLVKDKFVGGWAYTVEGAPDGYKEGLLLIVKDDKTYKVQIQVGGGTMMGENVSTKGSSIMFDVMVEGDKVAVKLTVSGSAISGTSNSSQGTFTVNGKKTLSAD